MGSDGAARSARTLLTLMAATTEPDSQVQLLRAKEAELKALKARLAASKAETPPTKAPAAAPASAPVSIPLPVLEQFMFSPIFFVAWAFGYLSDWNLLACLSLMFIPLVTKPLVEAGKKSDVVPKVI